MLSKLWGHDTAVQDIHGILHLDYKVPRKRFLNNAWMFPRVKYLMFERRMRIITGFI